MASSPLTPEQIAELQAGAALMQQRVQTGINVPGGLMIGQPGQLSAAGSGLPGSLYDYAQTAPVLSLTGNKDYENLNFQALPGTEYRLTVGGQVIGSASTPQEVAALVERANAISQSGGAQVDVRLQQAVQTADSRGVPSVQFADVYANRENNNGFLDVALPAALAAMGGGFLGPLIQAGQVAGTATALGTGLGTAAGSFGGSVLTGAPLDEALMKAAISGITAGGLQASGVFGGAPSAADGAASGKASAIAGTKLNAAGQIVDSVTGIPLSPAELIAAGASAPAAAASSTVGSAVPEIVVSSTVPAAFAPVISSGLGGVAANAVSNLTGAGEVLGNQPVTQEEWLQSTGQRPSDVSTSGGALPGAVGTTPVLGTGTVGQEVVVSGQTPAPANNEGALSAAAGTTPILGTGTVGQEAVVSGKTDKPAEINAGALSGAVGTTPVLGTGTVGQEAVVSGKTDKPAEIGGKPTDLLAPVAGEFAVAELTGGGKSLEQEKADGTDKKKSGLLTKVVGGLTLLDLLSSLLGGGNKGGPGALGPGAAAIGTRDSLDPIFKGGLPPASGLFATGSFAPRDMSGLDYERYGYGPAASFFENVPRNPAEYKTMMDAANAARPNTPRPGAGTVPVQPIFNPGLNVAQDYGPGDGTVTDNRIGPNFGRPRPNPSTPNTAFGFLRNLAPANITDDQLNAFLASPEGTQFASAFQPPVTRARGGAMKGQGSSRNSYAVKGPGTGRSDEIPALLSDGEYVMDAETVAMLGDGSSEAGAKRLDQFRVNLRKHKGRNLAKGKFSANAKAPEHYLSGGRV